MCNNYCSQFAHWLVCFIHSVAFGQIDLSVRASERAGAYPSNTVNMFYVKIFLMRDEKDSKQCLMYWIDIETDMLTPLAHLVSDAEHQHTKNARTLTLARENNRLRKQQ